MDDKTALKTSSAGMRFIAQMKLHNTGDLERLRTFIAGGYSPALLEAYSAEAWLQRAASWLAVAGKLRVFQVVAVDKYRVIVLLQAQKAEALYYAEMAVEEDYPHRVTEFRYHEIE